MTVDSNDLGTSLQASADLPGEITVAFRSPAVNDHARIGITELLPDGRQDSAIQFLQRTVDCFQSHKVTVQGVLTDTGSVFRPHRFLASAR